MNILDAYDLTGSLRDAAELAGCSHHTVARYVRAREQAAGALDAAGGPAAADRPVPGQGRGVGRARRKGKVRADVVHDEAGRDGLRRVGAHHPAGGRGGEDGRTGRAACGCTGRGSPSRGCGCSTTSVTARSSTAVKTVLVLRLAGVVAVPGRDPAAGQDPAERVRRAGRDVPPPGWGADVCADRQREDRHRRARRRDPGAQPGSWWRSPGTTRSTVHTCVPADPASKGGTESTVKIAKADLVPKDTNLREEYASFAELEAACEEFCDQVNARAHRVTRRPRSRCSPRSRPGCTRSRRSRYTVAFGVTRVVPVNTPMVTFEAGQYSVPHQLLGATVWVRVHGHGADEQVVIVHVGADGPVEVARHARATPGSPRIDDEHFPAAAGRRRWTGQPRAQHRRGGGVPGPR